MNAPKLPEPLRQRAVEYLRDTLDPESVELLRQFYKRDPEWGDELTPEEHKENERLYGFSPPHPFHFGTGMAIRNILRGAILDEELPVVHYGALEVRNWDDWYHGVLEDLVSDESN